MLSNISDLFTMASLVICMLLSGIIFYYLRTRISMLEQSVMDQAQLLQQVVTSLKSTQYRQQQMNVNANANANANVIYAQQHQDVVNSSQMQMNLIQVSDDSDSDSDSDNSDDSGSDNSDDSHNSESDDDESGNVCRLEDGSCKIIDLSTISSSTNYLRPSSHSEIKVIELKSNIRSKKDYVDNSSDEDDNDDEDDEEDDHEDDDEDDDEDDEDDDECSDRDEMNDDMNHGKNDTRNENEYIENKNDDNVNIKKMKSIVIENLTNSVSLDEMKNMPVNSLRSLAKTKLSNIDIPTINKMSKKEILKALHE